ncbi:MAG: thioredoxin fold domain-containing protein [Bacteroidetes bacterium]|nr:thioredoxin fold domain-containing protein [Bacteroidota bacterium]
MKKVVFLFILFSSPVIAQDKINWLTIEELEEAQSKEPRKVFVDLYTDWCGWCKRMDKATFQHPGIVAYVNENYYAVKFNAESKDTINFLGGEFKYVAQGRKGYNELAAVLANGKLSYPTIVYLDENLQVIQPVPGYMDPESFEQVITYLAGDHYKDQPFEQYKKNYQLLISQ